MWDHSTSQWPTRLVSGGLALLMLLTLGLTRPPGPPSLSAPPRPTNVAPLVWAGTEGGGKTGFLVILRQQADLGGVERLPTRAARRESVVARLRATAERTQPGLRALLERRGVPYRSFYIVNMLLVTGDRALVTELAGRPDVARIDANPSVRASFPPLDALDACPSGGVEWNVRQINGDDVWALGYTGQGVVVAGADTGYEWDHPALINQYRGWNGITATHDYNWHDAIYTNTHGTNICGIQSPEPCDDFWHGTHTMGTIVGDDGVNHIGVAPGARWIGCRNMDNGWGTPARYAECFEFFIAPYPVGGDPAQGDPAMAPDVINNSWECPPAEGCNWDTLQAVVEAVRAAGIMVVVSAGNSGSGCSTVSKPAAIYDASFTVGATNSNDTIASFSSRGPVTVDGSGRRKPDVSAPGVGVCSSELDGGYRSSDGTSMAAPHVAGVAALLWSADPLLIGKVEASERVIAQTARPVTTTQGCGGDGPNDVPNNVYGWGIVDALAAVEQIWLPMTITKQIISYGGFPPHLTYRLTLTNTSLTTLTGVVLTDTLPSGTSLAWASGTYTESGGVVSWAPAVVGPHGHLTATLTVATDGLAPGSPVVNERYGARADGVDHRAMGTPVAAVAPWVWLLMMVMR